MELGSAIGFVPEFFLLNLLPQSRKGTNKLDGNIGETRNKLHLKIGKRFYKLPLSAVIQERNPPIEPVGRERNLSS